MTYSGAVKVGGPATCTSCTDLMITKVAVGPMDNNAYLLRCRATDEQLLIDAANEPQTLLALIGDDGIASVVTTHQHGDHWQALARGRGGHRRAHLRGPGRRRGHPGADRRAGRGRRHGPGGQVELTARHLVGHTPGLDRPRLRRPARPPHVFTGDCLFPGGVGKTHKDPEAFARLLDDVETKIFDRLPDETWVYPGHGNDTTLGAERPHLPEWRARGW